MTVVHDAPCRRAVVPSFEAETRSRHMIDATDINPAYEPPAVVERVDIVAPLVAAESGAQLSAVFRTPQEGR
jgi:hypothetical protein